MKTDEGLKLLEENKNEAEKRINTFIDRAKAASEATQKNFSEMVEIRYKADTEAISCILKKVQDGASKEFSDDFNEEALCVLHKHFTYYGVEDNSEFMLDVIKKCIEVKADCSDLGSFFASMASEEMNIVSNVIKKSILSVCKPSYKLNTYN